MANNKIKKGCVISGGGAWGAFGAGTLAKLDEDYETAFDKARLTIFESTN